MKKQKIISVVFMLVIFAGFFFFGASKVQAASCAEDSNCDECEDCVSCRDLGGGEIICTCEDDDTNSCSSCSWSFSCSGADCGGSCDKGESCGCDCSGGSCVRSSACDWCTPSCGGDYPNDSDQGGSDSCSFTCSPCSNSKTCWDDGCDPSCPSGCSCGSNNYCCGADCGGDGCGGDCGSESSSDEGSGCDSGCSCGSNNYCCGDSCGTSVCGNDCGNESDSDVNTSTGCSSCSPACGQDAGTNVCGTDCGTCADYRSSSWNSPSGGSSFVHDMPITISGWAKDENGSTDGVDSVHVYIDGDPGSGGEHVATIPANSSTGDFSGSITADFYTSGFTGSEIHTIHLWAIKRDSNDCSNWKIDQRTIYLTNNAPSNESITIEGTSDGSLSATDLCVDHDSNNDQIVSVTATFSDVDSYPSPRFSDIEHADIMFDDSVGDYSDGEFYRVRYQDNGAGSYSVTEVTGDSQSKDDQLSISNTSASFNNTTDTLTINFDLNLSGLPADGYFNSDIYLRAWDFAGASSGKERKAGNIEFWNCSDVLVDGTVFDITHAYPLDSCGDLDPANSTGLDNVNLSFDDLGDGESSDTTAGNGTYSVTLNYLSNYNFSLLSTTRAFTHIVDLNNDGLTCSCEPDCDTGCSCPTGLDIETTDGATFTVNDGPVISGLDFGMVMAFEQWLQVVGGDITSYGTIDNDIPDTCQTDYDNGGECLPYTTVDRYTASGASLFRENGIAAAFGNISYGSSCANDGDPLSCIGDPNPWHAPDSSIQPPRSRGYAYFSNKLGSDYNEPQTSLSNMDLSGDPLIRLVDGTMTVDQDYTVAEDDFALFIVSEDLNINSDVENVHGIFLVDGSININGDNTSPQGLFEGVFIADADSSGTGQINNNRDREIANNLAPSSVFEYRQDMIISLLTEPALVQAIESTRTWEEVKP